MGIFPASYVRKLGNTRGYNKQSTLAHLGPQSCHALSTKTELSEPRKISNDSKHSTMKKHVCLLLFGDEILLYYISYYNIHFWMCGMFHKPWNKDLPFLTNQDFYGKYPFAACHCHRCRRLRNFQTPTAWRTLFPVEDVESTKTYKTRLREPGRVAGLCGNDWTCYHKKVIIHWFDVEILTGAYFSNGWEVQPPTRLHSRICLLCS